MHEFLFDFDFWNSVYESAGNQFLVRIYPIYWNWYKT